MALPFQTTLRSATEADFDALVDLMFAALREGESPYTEAQRQAWVPEPRRGSAWRTRDSKVSEDPDPIVELWRSL